MKRKRLSPMPYKDPEVRRRKQRECQRRYYDKNRIYYRLKARERRRRSQMMPKL